MSSMSLRPASAQSAPSVDTEPLGPILTREELEQTTPKSANPYIEFLPPGVEPDYRYWSAKLRFDSWDRAIEQPSPPARGATIVESEDNDTFATADPLPGLFAGGPAVTITGESDIQATLFPPTDGSEIGACSNETFSEATLVSLLDDTRVQVDAAIGDCALGSADADYYRFTLGAGDTISIDVDAAGPNTVIFLFGEFPYSVLDISSFDPYTGNPTSDPHASATAPTFGTYYAAILSEDGSTGSYEAYFSRDMAIDIFSVELEAGDVLSATSNLVAELGVLEERDGQMRERFGSYLPSSDLLPPQSPLLRTSSGSEVHIIARHTGTHYLRLRSVEPFPTAYTLQARIFRPGTEPTAPQKIFIDFNGATINADALFGSGPNYTNVTLSPLSAFLSGWGLNGADQNAVIEEVLAVIDENLSELAAVQPGFAYELLNSRDHADPFGQPGVSRVIIGGTQAQLGRNTIGVASAIDPGNYGLEDTAVVLLDLLSGPASAGGTLNQYTLCCGMTMVDLVGLGVGNIASHEIGHFLGIWHTNSQNGIHALVDGGGMLRNILGSSDDTIGDSDDEDVDFVDDVYSPGSGIRGIEDQAGRVAFALTSSTTIFSDGFESGNTAAWN